MGRSVSFLNLDHLSFNQSGAVAARSLELSPDVGNSAAPLPAALPLFATGLGGLGLLGCRRKWKAQAVA